MSRRQKRKKRGSIIFAMLMLPLFPVFLLLGILVECLKSKKIPGGDLFRWHRMKY